MQVYQDGVLTGERTLLRKMSEMQFNQWYFINNPVKDFPQSGRLDDLVIYLVTVMGEDFRQVERVLLTD